MKYIKRLLGLIPFLLLNAIGMLFTLGKLAVYFMKYGGEAVAYQQKNEPKMIADIYNNMRVRYECEEINGSIDRQLMSMLTEEERYKTSEAMKRFGGSFVSCIAQAWINGDPFNRRKVENQFANYFKEYYVTHVRQFKQTNDELSS